MILHTMSKLTFTSCLLERVLFSKVMCPVLPNSSPISVVQFLYKYFAFHSNHSYISPAMFCSQTNIKQWQDLLILHWKSNLGIWVWKFLSEKLCTCLSCWSYISLVLCEQHLSKSVGDAGRDWGQWYTLTTLLSMAEKAARKSIA